MKCKCEGVVCSLCQGKLFFPNGEVDPITGQAPLHKCFCDNGRVCAHITRKPLPSDPPDVIEVCICCGMAWTDDAV